MYTDTQIQGLFMGGHPRIVQDGLWVSLVYTDTQTQGVIQGVIVMHGWTSLYSPG